MIPLKQKKIRVFVGGIQQALCEAAFTEHAEDYGVVRIGFADLVCAGDLFPQRKIHRSIYRLIVVFAFTGKYPLVLLIHGHDINFGIAVKIIQPVRADAGRGKRHLTVFTELRKNILADVLILYKPLCYHRRRMIAANHKSVAGQWIDSFYFCF